MNLTAQMKLDFSWKWQIQLLRSWERAVGSFRWCCTKRSYLPFILLVTIPFLEEWQLWEFPTQYGYHIHRIAWFQHQKCGGFGGGGGGDSSTSRKVHIYGRRKELPTHTHNMFILWCAFVSSDHCFDSSTWMILGEFLKVVKLRKCVVLPLPPHTHTTSFIHSPKFNSSPLK